MTRFRLPLQLLVPVALLALAIIAAPPPAAAQGDLNELGKVVPNPWIQPQVIAIPAFGRDDKSPVEFETIPRIIRRDLELTGWFVMPADQTKVNSQNLYDVRRNEITFPVWQELGCKFLVNGNISSPAPDKLRAFILLYEVSTRKLVLRRYFDGPADDIRMLAHTISDEIVKMVIMEEGFARTQMLYISEQVPGIKEVSMMDSDAFNQRAVTRYNKICTTPAWGANGTEIYYTSYHGNRANIYGQILRTGQTWTIAAYGGTNHRPVWSETARRMVMVLSKDGNSEIYSANRDGSEPVRLTQSKATEGSPTWSPDGRQVCYASDEAGGVHLFIMNADGSNKRRLTSKGSWNDAPAWSPDGSRIAFVSRIGGVNDIYTVNADGSDYKRLTMNQGDNESPSWAPNSRHLAFSSDRTGQWQIFIMLEDGSNQRQLTTHGRNTQPEWGPAPK